MWVDWGLWMICTCTV